MMNQIWPWFEIKHLKSLLRMTGDRLDEMATANIKLIDERDRLIVRYQDMKTEEIVGELQRKVLEDKLAAFAKFDADGDGKPGGSKKKVKITK